MGAILESRFAQASRSELKAAKENNEKVCNLHEAYTTLLVKMDLLWDVVRTRRESREPADTSRLLAQLAAECERCCMDLGICNELPACSSDTA